MPDLSPLLDRLRKAEGPSRDLDYDIARATSPKWVDALPDDFQPTASVDSALELVEKLLLGWGWEVHRDDDHFEGPLFYWAAVRELTRLPTAYRARGPTPALAILIALFTALSSKED